MKKHLLFALGKSIMTLDYKPDINDVIRNDDTGHWYCVYKIEGRKVLARLAGDPREYR